jgi:hydroxymethylglutaryl-CoA lyase
VTFELVEVGPRDGLQNEDRTLAVETRIELIRSLVDAGVRRMEAVSFVHPGKVPQMAGAEEVMAGVPRDRDVRYIGLVLNRRGAERAIAADVTELNVVLPVTDTFGLRNQGKNLQDLIAEAAASVALGQQAGVATSVTLAVAFGCPFEGEVPLDAVDAVLARVAEMGSDEVAFADTIGVGVPAQVRAMTALFERRMPERLLRFHFHNTRNTGYANALTALESSPDRIVAIDAAVGGFGGCPFAPNATGNIGTEDLLYALDRVQETGAVGIDSAALVRIAEWLSTELASPIQSFIPRAGGFPALSL